MLGRYIFYSPPPRRMEDHSIIRQIQQLSMVSEEERDGNRSGRLVCNWHSWDLSSQHTNTHTNPGSTRLMQELLLDFDVKLDGRRSQQPSNQYKRTSKWFHYRNNADGSNANEPGYLQTFQQLRIPETPSLNLFFFAFMALETLIYIHLYKWRGDCCGPGSRND